ncbi:hypothetical protein [Methylibium sp.]|jgi:hypothetical protein|uniref:hypothetical protein n=1 Tax=Methylibium sp. TaxID=2067992 RepID=UPI003BAB9346
MILARYRALSCGPILSGPMSLLASGSSSRVWWRARELPTLQLAASEPITARLANRLERMP